MDRKQRLYLRSRERDARISNAVLAWERAIVRAGVPVSEREAFMDWICASQWDTFRTERMNKRIIIENEIKSLGIRFPNGTAQKEYCVEFSLPVDKISNVELAGAKEIGLAFEIDANGRCSLSGRPDKAGDFTLRLKYDTVDGEPRSELTVPVAFNPNPRSLWRNIPTKEDIIFYKKDSDTDYIKVEAGAEGAPRKDLVAASQRGRSHAQEGKPRDDHFMLSYCPESEWYVMAVADGAGSAKYSRKGSEVACRTAVEYCKTKLADNPEFEQAIRDYVDNREDADKRTSLTRQVIDIVYKGAMRAHEAVKRVADANEGWRLKDFATTLMFAICKKYDFGWFVASFWVGDGAMCLYDEKAGTAKLLGTPDEGEFSGQTRFLTMPEIFHDPDVAAKRLRMAIVPDFTALILMSDGVSDPMFETDRNLNDYNKWEEFWNKLKTGFPDDAIPGVDLSDDNSDAQNQLLNWLDFWSPGNHDDRTIAILY